MQDCIQVLEQMAMKKYDSARYSIYQVDISKESDESEAKKKKSLITFSAD